MIKLAEYVIEFIAAQGVEHVFMLPGGGAMHLNDALGRSEKLKFVCNLHEQASSICAEAYGKLTGNLGAALLTTGPGGTNAITGVAGAWLDSTPCLFISGQVKRSDLVGDLGVRQVGVQEVDIVGVVKGITKYAALVLDPETIRYHLERAVYEARLGRPGPVWIDIPLDVQASQIDPAKLRGYDPVAEGPPLLDESAMPIQVAEAIRMINASERPVLLAGNGVRLAGAVDEFLQVGEVLGIPILTTWLGMDLLPESHPLFVGRPGSLAPRGPNFAIQNSDLLLSVGARIDMALTAYAPDKLARAACKIMVDVDAAELNKMPRKGARVDLPIHADAREFLREMLRQTESVKRVDRGAWRRRCADWNARYPLVQPSHREPAARVSTYYFAEALQSQLVGGEVIVSGSSGSAIELFLLALQVKPGQRVLFTTALGAMGFGLPAAIGACLASGGKPTICVEGDGGFQLNIQELATLARLNLPIKFFILNNDGFASIRASQRGWFAGRLVAADRTSGLTLPDLTEVCRAYGVATAHIDNQSNLAEDIGRVLRAPGPVVCDVASQLDEPREPRTASAQQPDGTMVSKPLEDLFPFLDRDEFRANMIVAPLEDA